MIQGQVLNLLAYIGELSNSNAPSGVGGRSCSSNLGLSDLVLDVIKDSYADAHGEVVKG